jgi:GDP-L-fucose synthase
LASEVRDLVENSKVYVAGHKGLVGSAILRKLQESGHKNIIYRTKHELDLTRQEEVERFFDKERPDYVFMAAAKVGGILANYSFPAEFIYSNLAIQTNIIHAAWVRGVKRLLFLGSSCIYPKTCSQPIREEYILSGYLEPTNEPYAIAKIAGIKMCQSYNRQYGTEFISVMPTNLYGPNDNFDLRTSHVLPALIRKFHEGKTTGEEKVRLWGTGAPRREFLYVDDLASACLYLMENHKENEIVNIGTGKDITIRELAHLVAEIVGFKGSIEWESTKPDGTPRKLLDTQKIQALGWKPRIGLREGIRMTYEWYQTKHNECEDEK